MIYKFVGKFIFMLICFFTIKYCFTNDTEDRGSVPGRVISKTQKMVLDAALLYT